MEARNLSEKEIRGLSNIFDAVWKKFMQITREHWNRDTIAEVQLMLTVKLDFMFADFWPGGRPDPLEEEAQEPEPQPSLWQLIFGRK